jgi:hypothetical protein
MLTQIGSMIQKLFDAVIFLPKTRKKEGDSLEPRNISFSFTG